jgi:hypothetical protein
MWHCLKCGEDIEDHFELCWNCQANRRGLRQFNNREAGEIGDERVRAIVNKKHKPMKCLRCANVLKYAGTKKFHQGSNLGVLGDWSELLVGKETVEMYVCSECGHVEFFAFAD